MVWWSFVLGIVGGILLCGAFGICVYTLTPPFCIVKYASKRDILDAAACLSDWAEGRSGSIDEPHEKTNQD